jgi:HPt (histidine-containing phosphotransfer) domain-containing protein
MYRACKWASWTPDTRYGEVSHVQPLRDVVEPPPMENSPNPFVSAVESSLTKPLGNTPLASEFANDPDMAELVELFVSEVPHRIDMIAEAFRAEQWDMLQRISHQLKGASAGYGFPDVGVAAGKVEHIIKSGPIADEVALAELSSGVQELITLCRRVGA